MSTLQDVVSSALTAIGQLGQGQTLSNEDGQLGLRQVNLLLSKSSVKRLFLYTVATRQYQLTPALADYTIGPTGAIFTATRPTLIEGAQINPVGTDIWLPLSILDKPKWDAIRTKNSTASIPDDIWPEYTFPNLTFHVNPTPIGAPYIRLGCWEQLTQFAKITDPVSFPPSYEEYLESNLAMMLAPYYDQPVNPGLAQRAADAALAVMQYNAQSLGGALDDSQLLKSPNIGQPQPLGGGALPAQQ